MDFLLRNATVINEGKSYKANIKLVDGVIDIIDTSLSISSVDGCTDIDMSGLVVLPGVIDDHVHFREPGMTEKGDISSESRAAVAGGVTSYMDMPNTKPPTISRQAVDDKCRLAENRSYANYAFYIGATNDNLQVIKSIDPCSVAGLKVFMGSSTGNLLVDKEEILEQIFAESPLLIAVHAEDEATIQRNTKIVQQLYGTTPPSSVHPLIRTAEACFIASSKAVNLAKKYNSRLHLLHLSSAEEMSLLSPEDIDNKRITAEVCINHLFLDEDYYKKGGNFFKCNPAIKTKVDRDALRHALVEHKLDVVGTDHAPHTSFDKQNDFYRNPSGIPSIQHSLIVMIEMAKQGVFSLNDIPTWMSHNPAKCFHVHNRGFIREGYAADLAVVDLNTENTVCNDDCLYKCGWTPYNSMTFSSKVRYTFVNGNMVYDGKSIIGDPKGEKIIFK